ncbi:MAG: DUF1573 domain-containing protein [Saprospiraceae bacterium]|nr:DUF1573 domain-containing protein [Saprospiraceae bacterium]
MHIRMLFALMILSIFSCTPEGGNPGKSLEEIKLEGASNSAIVRNPVSANTPVDTVNIAKITFEETKFDFGDVDEGKIVEHVFRFKNTGKVPLLISDARSTCGCTVPVWPKDPIAPGQGGEINVKFDTNGKNNLQKKPVTITANTYPSTTVVQLVGVVRGKNALNASPQ